MARIEKFATVGIAPSQRLRYWNDLVDRIYPGTFVNTPSDAFAGGIWSWQIGDLDMTRPCSSQATVGRAPGASEEGRIILHLQCRGTGRYRQDNRDCLLRSGDFVLGAAHRPYDFELSAHELLAIEFPAAPLAERIPHLEDAMQGQVHGGSASSRVLHDFLLSLWRQGDYSADDAAWERGVASVFYDLVALALRAEPWPAKPRLADTELHRRVMHIIEASLCSGDLSTSAVAQACGTSVRTVQNMFATIGTTPTAYMLERRLRRAADRLVAAPDASITEVAFEFGFNDSAYFTRRFRQLFGCAPRDWRAGR